ncbi:MAG: lysoplasmalogenase [Promethearchaeota archaeon]
MEEIFWVLIGIIINVFIVHLANLYRKLIKEVVTKSLLMIFINILSILATIKFNFPLYGILISIALMFSLMGDIFLVVNGDAFFLYGLISFAIAHILYIIAFITIKSSIGLISIEIFANFIVLSLISILFFILIKKNLKEMKIPVLIYLILITFMASLSIRCSWLTLIGAISFILSDMELAVNKFYKTIPHNSIFNGIFYFPAQFLFALSVLFLGN